MSADVLHGFTFSKPRLLKQFNQILVLVFMIVLAVPFVFPFLWMISSSLKPINDIFAFPPNLIPNQFVWQNYIDVFTFQPFARQFFNSLYIATAVTAGTLIVSSLSGYGFARIQFKGNGILFMMLLSSLMMPAEVTIIPNFIVMQILGLTDTHFPLIALPILGAGGISATFIMRSFFLNFPIEVEEAATIDGLSRWGIFWRVALPIASPALASVAILTFLASWNSFLEPLVYLNNQQLFTLPIALRSYADQYGAPIWNVKLAATTISVIPVLILYLFAQRRVVQTMAFSGVKG